MWTIKMVFRAFVIFAVPVVILALYGMFSGLNRSKATGLGVIQAQGPFFIVVGLFYVAFGVFLWSPLPEMLFRYLLPRINQG